MNPDFHFVLAMDVIAYTADVGERFTDQCVYESDRFGGGSVMVRAGICHDGRTQLNIVQGTLNAIKYRDDIIDAIVLPFLQQRNFDHVFQHDNARSHVASVCQDFLNRNHIRVLPWPALSPDLRQNPPETLQELRDTLVHGWNNIPGAFIQRLIRSMRRKCEAVVAAKVVTHVTELRKPPYCMTISVCFDIALFAMPI
jgi:hypothetical protein